VTAVVVNYEGGELLLECLASLAEQKSLLETIVVDNGSRDGSAASAKAAYPSIKLISPARNVGFAGGANLGAREARTDLILFLNPDVALGRSCLDALTRPFADPDVGVVGPPLEIRASAVTEYGATIDFLGSPRGLGERKPPLYVAGCALMTRSALFRDLGGFDERFFMFVEDVDYCWRVLLRGYDVRVPDMPAVRHEGGASIAGGYPQDAGLSSTRLRIVLRERNTLATLLKCYGRPAAAVAVPGYVLQTIGTAALVAASGRTATARSILAGLAWNVQQLPVTLRERRRVQSSREIGDAVIVRRMHRGLAKLSLLVRFGVPRISEPGSTPLEAEA
jgi:hypothetical protein